MFIINTNKNNCYKNKMNKILKFKSQTMIHIKNKKVIKFLSGIVNRKNTLSRIQDLHKINSQKAQKKLMIIWFNILIRVNIINNKIMILKK